MEKRFHLLLYVTIIILLLWIWQLAAVHISDPHNLKSQIAMRQNPTKVIINPKRGNIFTGDRQLLVSSIINYQVDLDITSIKNHCQRNGKNYDVISDTISTIISKYTDHSTESVKRLLYADYPAIFIDDDLSESDLRHLKDEFSSRDIPGVCSNFSKIERTYPKGKLAARLLGMVGPPHNNSASSSGESIYTVEGKCGLEKSYNDDLSGIFGWKQTIFDAQNKRIPIVRLKDQPAVNGNNLILTIDMDIQEILEENLRNGLNEYKAKNAIGIIMEPFSGNIVALSGISSQDTKRSAAQLRSQSNMVASFMFEPGSVMKPITALLAVEENLYKPDEKISTENYNIKYENNTKTRTIKDDHKYKELNLEEIIAHSSNVGISKTVEKIGNKKLYERMLAMGFGQSTSSNLSNEASGIFRKLKDWQGYSLHSISFGQEVSVTALQLAVAYSALANGGNVMRPNILKQIEDANGEITYRSSPQKLRTISDKKSLDTVKHFLKSVFDYGTARYFKLSSIEMAGKTGTAEKQIFGEHGYSKDKYTSVFAGFFPVDTPKYVIIIVYDEADFASYSYYSAMSAGPTFSQVARQIIKLPDSNILANFNQENRTYIKAPDCLGKSYQNVSSILYEAGIEANFINHEKANIVLDQFPKPGISYDNTEKLSLVFGTPKVIEDNDFNLDYQMPDLIGKTLRQALTQTNKRGIKLLVDGNGLIKTQSIPAGTQIKYGEQCRIKAE